MVPEDRSYFGEMACHRARCRCCLAIDDTLCVSQGRFYEAACLWFRDPDVSERTWHDSYIGSWPNCWLRAFYRRRAGSLFLTTFDGCLALSALVSAIFETSRLAIAGEAPSAHFHFEECPFLSEPNAPRLLGDQSSCEPDRKPSPPVGPALTGRFSGKVGWDGKKISTSWKKSGALWQPATANAFQMEESIY